MARGKKQLKRDARDEAYKGNYQDAFADDLKAKSSRGGGTRRNKSKNFKRGGARGSYKYGDRPGNNSPGMYSPTSQTLVDVTNIPVSYTLGRPMPYPDDYEAPGKDYQGNFVIQDSPTYLPGIMSFQIFQTLGEPGDAQSPINTAANTLYNHIRANNSRAATYMANDLMLSIYAVTQPYLYLKYCQRAYGVLNHGYSMIDKYTPEALIRSMGINYVDLQRNFSDFRTWMNIYALKIAQFPIPTGIQFFERLDFLYSNIYVDSESPKPQYYIYNPVGFYRYYEGDENLGTRLEFDNFCSNGKSVSNHTVKELMDFGDSLLEMVYSSEQNKTMFADMIKAFGSSLVGTVQIAETYEVSPIYRPEVLSQLENADIIGISDIESVINKNTEINNSYIKMKASAKPMLWNGHGLDVSMTDYSKVMHGMNQNKHLLNFHVAAPSRDDIMVATRLMCDPFGFIESDRMGKNIRLAISGYTGVEIVASAFIWYYLDSGELNNIPFTQNITVDSDVSKTPNVIVGGVPTFAQKQVLTSLVSAFDWHPKFRMALIGYDGAPTSLDSEIVKISYLPWNLELQNFTQINKQELDNMHMSAKYGMFMPKNLGQESGSSRVGMGK